MKRFAGLVCVIMAASVLIASCSKDKESGNISFDSPAVFLQAGEKASLNFSAFNIDSFSISGQPEGWDSPVIDDLNKTVTITAPTEFDDEVVKTGTIILYGTVRGGSPVSATIFVGVVESVDMSSKQANSYLVREKETNYLFDAMHKGDGATALATASLNVVWQSQSGLIQYLELKNGKASFFVAADNDDKEKIKAGNAIIGAYDAAGTLIWSWHIWLADYDPAAADGAVNFNGYTMMNRNLGALANDNSTKENILKSYGLYYQWGRKDPFIGPSTYQASNGSSATMYSSNGARVYLQTKASSAETGTQEYALHNPVTFISGVSASENDWLWSAHSNALWSADSKTVNDPCPYGWRIAPAAAFDGLSIVGVPKEEDYDKYGWMLGRDGAESLFIGAGRRRYDNGTILNVYNPTPMRSMAVEAQPWEGLYWTAGASGAKSSAFYFWFEKKTTTGGVENAVAHARANGMQVRCVKVENN